MRKLFAASITCLAFICVLASCGHGGEQQNPDPVTPPTTTEAATEVTTTATPTETEPATLGYEDLFEDDNQKVTLAADDDGYWDFSENHYPNEKDPDNTETTTVQDDTKVVSLLGTWELAPGYALEFAESNSINLYTNVNGDNQIIEFNSDGSATWKPNCSENNDEDPLNQRTKIEADDIVFDGNNLMIEHGKAGDKGYHKYMFLSRIGGDPAGMDGEYIVTDGDLLTEIQKIRGDNNWTSIDVTIIIKNNKLAIKWNNFDTFEVSGGDLSLSENTTTLLSKFDIPIEDKYSFIIMNNAVSLSWDGGEKSINKYVW